MIVVASGSALIQHKASNVVYSVDAADLSWHVEPLEERAMGPELAHSAIIDHPELGKLSWFIWEYPAGFENDRETDVGEHTLLNNFTIELENESGLVTSASIFSASPEPRDRLGRIAELVDWFLELYEDPASSLPYESAEGGYQWIWGGPADARDVLSDNFPDEDEAVIEAAVLELESDGIDLWSPKPEFSERDELQRDASESGFQVDVDVRDEAINELLANIPQPEGDPVFFVGSDGRIELFALPPDAVGAPDNDGLLSELRDSSQSLMNVLAGTNAHTDLLAAATRYEIAVSAVEISISRIYRLGIHLENLFGSIQKEVKADQRPALQPEIDASLNTLTELHAAYVMTHAEGRNLVEAASAYRRSSKETEELRRATNDLSKAIQGAPELFEQGVRNAVAESAKEIGTGPYPERSNQIVETTVGNVLAAVFRGLGQAAKFAAVPIVTGAIVVSAPGAEITAATANFISNGWAFVMSVLPALQTFALIAATDVSWLTRLCDLLQHYRGHQLRFNDDSGKPKS